MVRDTFLLTASAILIGWEITYMLPLRSALKGQGNSNLLNRKIVMMEWIGGAIPIIGYGLLNCAILLYGDPSSETAFLVFLTTLGIFIVLAVLRALAGGRAALTPMRLYPWVLMFCALLMVTGIFRFFLFSPVWRAFCQHPPTFGIIDEIIRITGKTIIYLSL